MAYFNDICTEEELKEQFRNLLIKHDYRNPNKKELIEAIRREYEKKLSKVRCVDDYQAENRSYNRQEYTELILGEKRYINRLLKKIVTTDKVRFLLLKQQLVGDDYIELYNRFNIVAFAPENETVCKNYYVICREIERATEYLVKDKTEYETLMAQIKTMMGKHVQQTLANYEELYIDPIDMQQLDTLCNIVNSSDVTHVSNSANISNVSQNPPAEAGTSELELYVKVAYVIILFFMIMAIVLRDMTLLMFTLPFVLWIVFIRLWDVLVVRPFEKDKEKVQADNQADK